VDRERFEAEALPHVKRLYGTAYRMTRNPADAEDLVQETLFRAFRGFDRFQPGTNIRAWLHTILHRVRTDALRRAGRRPQMEELTDDGPPVPPSQEALAWGGEAVERALRTVPAVFREAVLLRDVEELSYAEIAAALQVPQGTVMSRIHRGRALLRSALAGAKA
jgi:RNA polymerase sigma-70 factor, ECF subfamily